MNNPLLSAYQRKGRHYFWDPGAEDDSDTRHLRRRVHSLITREGFHFFKFKARKYIFGITQTIKLLSTAK